MKLYAQHGFGQGEKTKTGIRKCYIDGVIYSPRDIGSEQLKSHISDVASINSAAEQFFDPQYYAAYNVSDPEARLGHLVTCTEYQSYFKQRRRRELERNITVLKQDIRDCLSFQNTLQVTGLISPNILITRSFDSIDCAIAKNFISLAGKVSASLPGEKKKPLYATLAVSREALLDRNELFSFLEDITVLDSPPDGFYLLIAASSGDARADIFHADVIAGWLLINHSLSVNGYQVINGYSDLLTPFLGMAGATAGATGWWLNSRTFSLDRFLPAGGGRLPNPRYLSNALLNRITYFELAEINGLQTRMHGIPNILNGLGTDDLYPPPGYEPERANEVLQSWEAIKKQCMDLCRKDDQKKSLQLCRSAIDRATEAYASIESRIRLDPKSNSEHLEAIKEGLRLFVRQAEIGGTGEEP